MKFKETVSAYMDAYLTLIADASLSSNSAKVFATLNYTDTLDAEKSYKYELPKYISANYYYYSTEIPSDAKLLKNIVFKAASDTEESNEIVKELNMPVMSKVEFYGLNNSTGAYNSMTFKVIGENGYESSARVYSSSITMNLPKDNYSYSLSDGYTSYIKGTFSAESGIKSNISIASAKEPISLRFRIDEDSYNIPEYVKTDLRYSTRVKVRKDGEDAYYPVNYINKGFAKGEIIDYQVEISDYAKRWIKVPSKVTGFEVKDSSINLVFEPYNKSKISGYVKDKSGDPLEGIELYLLQEIENSGDTISIYEYAKTDKNGKYEIEVYDDFAGTVTAKSIDYDEATKSFEKGASSVGNIELIYNPSNSIKLSTLLQKTGTSSKTLSSDLSLIKSIKSPYSWTDLGNLDLKNKIYKITEVYVANQTVELKVVLDNYAVKKDVYQVKLDENGRGSLIIEGTEFGYPEIHYHNGDSASSLMTYGFIYDSTGQKVMMLSGQEILSGIESKLKEGNYTLILFCSYEQNLDSFLGSLNYLDFYQELVNGKNFIRKNFSITNGEVTEMEFYEKLSPISPKELQNGDPKMVAKYRLDKSGRAIFDVSAKIAFNNSEENKFALSYIKLLSQGQLDGDVYVNGSRVTVGSTTGGGGTLFSISNYAFPESVKNGEAMNLSFSVIMDITETSNMSLEYTYMRNSDLSFRSSLSLSNVSTPAISLIAPSQVLNGDDSKNVYLKGIGIPGATVEIYDNGDIIAKETVKENSAWSSYVTLRNPDIPAVHSLSAKLTNGTDSYESEIAICEILNKDATPYVHDFNFRNYQGFHLDSLSESTESKLFAYNPHRKSYVWFKIANISPDDLSSVKLCLTKEGETRYFDMEYQDDNSKNHLGYWYIYDYLGDPGKISVVYTLEEDAPIGKLTGSENITYSVDKLLEGGIDDSKFPDEIKKLINTEEISQEVSSNTKTSFKQRVYIGDSLSLDYDISSTVYDKDSIDVSTMTKYHTDNGDFWMNLPTMSGTSVEMKMKVVYSKELAAYLGMNTTKSSDVASKLMDKGIFGLFARASMDPSNPDDVVTVVDVTCNAMTGGEILQIAATGEEFTKLTGNTLNVIGGATTAYTLVTAKLGKDGSSLNGLLDSIQYDERAWEKKGGSRAFEAERLRIAKDIIEYKSMNRRSVIIKKVLALSGFVADKTIYVTGPLGKGLSLSIAAGGMAFDTVSQEYDIWWQGIVDSIGALRNRNTVQVCPDCGFVDCVCVDKQWMTCTGCGARFLHGTPHKCGHKSKKDDINDPRWKIDPSGYVYEAISDQRIEGITATALYNYGTTENPVFSTWAEADDWGETNPQATDSFGKYGWDVPMGDWKVLFEDKSDSPKYLNTTTKAMAVPPVHDQVNIGLLSTESPAVNSIGINPEFAEIEFSMYLQAESLDGNIVITNGNGDLVPIKEISFIEPVTNAGYTSDDTYNTNVIASSTFVKKIKVLPDKDKYSGGFRIYKNDGSTKETYIVDVSENVKSYSGVALTKYSDSLSSSDRGKVAEVTADIPSGEYSETKTVTLSTATVSTSGAATSIFYTTDGSTPTINSLKYTTPLEIEKDTVVRAIGTKVGMDNSDSATFEYTISLGKILSTKSAVNKPTDTSSNNDDSSSEKSDKDIGGAAPSTVPNKMETDQLKPGSNETPDQSGKREVYIPTKEEKEKAVEQFTDAKEHWAKESIGFAIAKGLFKGVSEKEFAPDVSMTRAMFVTVLGRLAEAKTDVYNMDFGDVEGNQWYAGSVAWATENKIVNGVGNNSFAPNDDITREQLCVMIYNYISFAGLELTEDENKEDFGDIENVSSWAKDAVQKVQRLGLINGRDGNIFDPSGKATRGEVAAILERFVELMAK